MGALIFGLLAAVTGATQALINKGLTDRYPARQLLGVLYFTNCLVLLPFAPFVEWHWTGHVWLLHVVSVGALVLSAICLWDLYAKGAASSTTTAGALSPLAAAAVTAVALPGTFAPIQVAGAAIASGAVLWSLRDAFGDMGRRGVAIRVVLGAIGSGVLTVASRLLADEGVGVVETYVVRTAIAALVCCAMFPPRHIPLHAIPRLFPRSVLNTASFVFIILGVQQGSPVLIQTLVATVPLFVIVGESWRSRRLPPPRTVGAALLAVVAVAIVLTG